LFLLGLSAQGLLSRVVVSVFLIIAGLLLFLCNLGWLPIHNVWDYWPAIFIVFGIARWIEHRSPSSQFWAAAMIIFGSLYLCISVGWLHIRSSGGSLPLAILFIALGVAALTKILDSRAPVAQITGAPRSREFDPNVLSDAVIFGSVNRRVESSDFRGGLITSVLGSVELDLRRASIQRERPVILEIVSVLGSVKLRIPESWRVSIVGTPVLGSYEDRTIPQARDDVFRGNLMVSGSCVLGSIEIDN
jgi:predicted membrane protein